VEGFRSPGGEFAGVAFAPDGQLLAAEGRGRFVRLLAPTGMEVRRFEGAPAGHRVVAVSPDGKVVAAGGRDRSIHLWEAATGKRLLRLLPPPAEGGGVLCLAFSPDGRLLASGGWGTAACVWDVATGQRWCALPGHDYWVSSLCFSPDGKTL